MRLLLFSAILSWTLIPAHAIEAWKTMKLWPGKAPGETYELPAEAEQPARPGQKQVIRIGNVSTPMLSVFKHTNPNGTAVVIFPGGGYNIFAWDVSLIHI